MGVKAGMRALLRHAPDGIEDDLKLPEVARADRLNGAFDYLHLFVTKADDLDTQFPEMKKHVAPRGLFYVSWPKSRQLGSDLTIKSVIAIGYSHGMVESTTLSVNAVWSAIKFTHPKPGKTYNNSYGRLRTI
jgi:hypothetical protein